MEGMRVRVKGGRYWPTLGGQAGTIVGQTENGALRVHLDFDPDTPYYVFLAVELELVLDLQDLVVAKA